MDFNILYKYVQWELKTLVELEEAGGLTNVVRNRL
jgi:hypothetical protein